MRTPNFLIAGSPKCGTTSVYAWLKQHPDVFFPEVKEPTYFADGYGIRTWQEYLTLYESARTQKIVGDASAGYFVAPESPQLIEAALGNQVKILILVRDPVERAFSLYKWMVMEGYEPLWPFERALEAEEERFHSADFRRSAPQFFWDYMYVRSTLYADRIEAFERLFPGFVKVLVFDDFRSDPIGMYEGICNFLGIDKGTSPTLSHENKGRLPRSPLAQYMLRKSRNRFGRYPLVGAGWRRAMRATMEFNKLAGTEGSLPPSTRQTLIGTFKSDIARLEKLLGRDLSHWGKGAASEINEPDYP